MSRLYYDLDDRVNFSIFKSNICNELTILGDLAFLIKLLENDYITMCWNRKWYLECFYLLAMLDHISRINNIPLSSDYNEIRQYKLEKKVYPTGILLKDKFLNKNNLEEAEKNSIPEFLAYNIIENNIK